MENAECAEPEGNSPGGAVGGISCTALLEGDLCFGIGLPVVDKRQDVVGKLGAAIRAVVLRRLVLVRQVERTGKLLRPLDFVVSHQQPPRKTGLARPAE